MKKVDAARLAQLVAEADTDDGAETIGRILAGLERTWPETDWTSLVARFERSTPGRPIHLLRTANEERARAVCEIAKMRAEISEAFGKGDVDEISRLLERIREVRRRAGLPPEPLSSDVRR